MDDQIAQMMDNVASSVVSCFGWCQIRLELVEDSINEATTVETKLALERDYIHAVIGVQKDLWNCQQTMGRDRSDRERQDAALARE